MPGCLLPPQLPASKQELTPCSPRPPSTRCRHGAHLPALLAIVHRSPRQSLAGCLCRGGSRAEVRTGGQRHAAQRGPCGGRQRECRGAAQLQLLCVTVACCSRACRFCCRPPVDTPPGRPMCLPSFFHATLRQVSPFTLPAVTCTDSYQPSPTPTAHLSLAS